MRAQPARKEAREVVLYCDGACRGNPGPGGFGAVLRSGRHETELSGSEPRTTNNRMELRAAIEGLAILKEPCAVRVVTDSQYLRRGMTEWLPKWLRNGWRTSDRKPVLNRDLWERLMELCARHEVRWDWTPGHAGDRLNERCDALANGAIDRMLGCLPGGLLGGSAPGR
ncbi:MAG: ribonuclease HI [Planctomycetes bacterium]|nr:ribonuclease HI [Planctomycetota bacterium]